MENEDPSITFDRVAGESAMVRQLLGLLISHSPGALAAVRAIDVDSTQAQLEASLASDVFIAQAMAALKDITARAVKTATHLAA